MPDITIYMEATHVACYCNVVLKCSEACYYETRIQHYAISRIKPFVGETAANTDARSVCVSFKFLVCESKKTYLYTTQMQF